MQIRLGMYLFQMPDMLDYDTGLDNNFLELNAGRADEVQFDSLMFLRLGVP